MAKKEKKKKIETSKTEDLNELLLFRERKKIQNEAFKKIVNEFSKSENTKK